MAGWKENKMVAVIAGVVLLLCVILIVKMAMSKQSSGPKMTPEEQRQLQAVEQQTKGGAR